MLSIFPHLQTHSACPSSWLCPGAGLSPSNRPPCLGFGLGSANGPGGRRRAEERQLLPCWAMWPDGSSPQLQLLPRLSSPFALPPQGSSGSAESFVVPVALSTPAHTALSFNPWPPWAVPGLPPGLSPRPEKGHDASGHIQLLARRASFSLPGRQPQLQSM